MPGITSTDYYRQNKEEGKIMHRCPHCDFTTPYNKSNLMNHIYAKHTPEHKRPYQCDHCARGFSQKSHLIKHLKKEHQITNTSLENKITNILYKIQCTEKKPKSKKTKARFTYYQQNPIIKSTDMQNKLHEYLDQCFLSNNEIHYDKKNGFIKLTKILLKGKVKINGSCKCKICIRK